MAPFWLAMILQLIFGQTLGLFPLGGRLSTDVSIIYPLRTITGFNLIDSLLEGNFVVFSNSLWHLFLPALALATYPFGLTVRMVRTMMIEVLQENYTRSALAWGLPQRIILFKYALKNAISSTVIALGMSFAYSLTGAFLDEIIFVWPGLGTYTALSILALDYPAIMGTVIAVGVLCRYQLTHRHLPSLHGSEGYSMTEQKTATESQAQNDQRLRNQSLLKLVVTNPLSMIGLAIIDRLSLTCNNWTLRSAISATSCRCPRPCASATSSELAVPVRNR